MSKVHTIIHTAPLMLGSDSTAAALGISDGLLKQLVRNGELPPPRKISAGRVGWLWRELQAFSESRPISDLAPGPGSSAFRSAPPKA
jgi:prophage regulatory protein